MKKELLLHTHCGLGDEFMLNALVRHYCKLYERVYKLVLSQYLDEVAYMYRDLTNIKFIIIPDREYSVQFKVADSYRMINPHWEYLRIGHEYLYNTTLPADRAFYKQVGLDFEKRYTDFYFERNLEKEQEVYEYYNPNNEPYVFVHHDTDRKRGINYDYIKNKDLKRIILDFKISDKKLFRIFDYLKLIENAEECHMIDSSFKCLTNSIIKQKDNMYFHKYLDNVKDSTHCQPYWIILE